MSRQQSHSLAHRIGDDDVAGIRKTAGNDKGDISVDSDRSFENPTETLERSLHPQSKSDAQKKTMFESRMKAVNTFTP